MPKIDNQFPTTSVDLWILGRVLATQFCVVNQLPPLTFQAHRQDDWYFDCCAYYRESEVHICLPKCGKPSSQLKSRNWTWPGSTIDRSPYGVVAHELGHHADRSVSLLKYAYSGDYSTAVMNSSGEVKLTNYCPNPAEWFAEMFRLFVTNPDLLKCCRPRTYERLLERFKPVVMTDWKTTLRDNCPEHIVESQLKKIKHA